MSGQIPAPIGSITLVVTLLVGGVGIAVPTNIARADDCITAPNSPAPKGKHWYYRTDRAKQRKCWYLRAPDQPKQPAAQAISETAHATNAASTLVEGAEGPRVRALQAALAQRNFGVGEIDGDFGSKTLVALKAFQASQGLQPTGTGDSATLAALGLGPTPDPLPQQEEVTAVEKPAAALAAAPMSSIPDNSDSPPESQPASMSNATTEELVQQSAQEVSTAPSIREAPQATMSSQTSTVQATARAATAAPEAPNPPAVTFNAQEPNLVPSDDRTGSVRPTVGARAPNETEGTARGDTSTTNAAGLAASLTGTPLAMFLILALGLGVAGVLFRGVVKVAAMRRRPIRIDHFESDWSDVRQQHEWRDDQHGSVERDEIIDDPHRSIAPGANDVAHHPFRADNERPNNAPRTGSIIQTSDKVRKHEELLRQLKRDLDQLLQSPTRA